MTISTCCLPIKVMMGRYGRRNRCASESGTSQRTVWSRVAGLDAISVRPVRVMRKAPQRQGSCSIEVSVLLRRPLLPRRVHRSPSPLLTHRVSLSSSSHRVWWWWHRVYITDVKNVKRVKPLRARTTWQNVYKRWIKNIPLNAYDMPKSKKDWKHDIKSLQLSLIRSIYIKIK